MVSLFFNGKIWQWSNGSNLQSPEDRYAHWFTVCDEGMVHQVGRGSPTDELTGQTTSVIDLHGSLVIPGLHDSHIHAYFLGESSEYLNLTGCKSYDDFIQRLQEYEAKYPKKSWIVGYGWEQDSLSADGRYPSRKDIDDVIKNRPVLLYRACWHIIVVNTKALEVAGVDISQKQWNVESGAVDVDKNGPTGIFREAAVMLVSKHISEDSEETRYGYLKHSLRQCISHGLTAVHTNDENAWDLYQKLQRNGDLPIRAFLTPSFDEIKNETAPAPKSQDGLISVDRVKIFSDGSLGAETAAVREPYIGTDNTGILMESDSDLLEKVSLAHSKGYRLEIHAIGDRAAEQVLSTLKKANVPPESRPILTHCQILGNDLINKMREQGVIGNIQPSFVITDSVYIRKRLAKHVLPFSYCWKTMIEKGVVCAGGSDAPIETCNPFQGIYDAIYRCKPDKIENVFLPNECLTFEEALKIYSVNGAYAAMQESHLGEISPGFLADFVVLHHDIVKDHTKLLAKDLVRSVYVGGIQRYEAQRNSDGMSTSSDFSNSTLPGKNGRVRVCHCCSLPVPTQL